MPYVQTGEHWSEMDTWHVKELGDAAYGVDQLLEESLQPLFREIYARAGSPPDMAVFTRLESEGRLHCELVVYFSPAVAEVARTFGAGPCLRPAPAGLKLFAGDERAWSALFPERMG